MGNYISDEVRTIATVRYCWFSDIYVLQGSVAT